MRNGYLSQGGHKKPQGNHHHQATVKDTMLEQKGTVVKYRRTTTKGLRASPL